MSAVLESDPIELEILRSRLEAIAIESASTVGRTAVSPIVTETNDYSATLLDRNGRLLCGGGVVLLHFGAAMRVVSATIARYGWAGIEPGDVFLANDPHNGGGLHPQDVFAYRPVFVEVVGDDPVCVGWTAMSAHMMDMGGLVPGSFAPAATECYQEAFRVPPVRLLRAGREVSDVWDLLRVNIRMTEMVEMDLRALVAGAHVAADRMAALAAEMGADRFMAELDHLQALGEQTMRARIATLAPGHYTSVGWVEWSGEWLRVPCTLEVRADELIFDFTGAPPQQSVFFNTKPYILMSEIMTGLWWTLARDLPYNDGLYAPVSLICPEGSLLDCRPPAPIGASHMHAALMTMAIALRAVGLAIGASPDFTSSRHLTSPISHGLLSPSTWTAVDEQGVTETWLPMEGNWCGGPAGLDRDGFDCTQYLAGPPRIGSAADIETIESLFPVLFEHRRVNRGADGAGEHRSGAGIDTALRPHGVDALKGYMLGMRRYLPMEGIAGGRPGATTRYLRTALDGETVEIAMNASDVVLRAGETFRFRNASSGGAGDPLWRDPAAVAGDVAAMRLTLDEALEVYGVVIGDDEATASRRSAMLRDRLARANAPTKPVTGAVAPSVNGDADLPLYPGVVQRGRFAVAIESGAVLAEAADHWTDGCPVLIERVIDDGPVREIRSYLDPSTGRALHVEAVPDGDPRSFTVMPNRWTS